MVEYSQNGVYVLFPLPSSIFHMDTCPRRQISREITCIQLRRICDYLFQLAILSNIVKLYNYYYIGILNKKLHTTTMLTAMVLPPITINVNEIRRLQWREYNLLKYAYKTRVFLVMEVSMQFTADFDQCQRNLRLWNPFKKIFQFILPSAPKLEVLQQVNQYSYS